MSALALLPLVAFAAGDQGRVRLSELLAEPDDGPSAAELASASTVPPHLGLSPLSAFVADEPQWRLNPDAGLDLAVEQVLAPKPVLPQLQVWSCRLGWWEREWWDPGWEPAVAGDSWRARDARFEPGWGWRDPYWFGHGRGVSLRWQLTPLFGLSVSVFQAETEP